MQYKNYWTKVTLLLVGQWMRYPGSFKPIYLGEDLTERSEHRLSYYILIYGQCMGKKQTTIQSI